MVYDIHGNALTEPKKVRILEYNIGNFTGDGTFDGYAGDDLPGYIADWAQFIGAAGADICLLVENRYYIDAGNTTPSKTALFDPLYSNVTDYDYPPPLQSWQYPWRVTLLSNVQQSEVVRATFTHQATANGGSKYIKVVAPLNGVQVCVVVAHLTHGDTQTDIDTRAMQMQELIALTAPYSNVIVGGDFNTRSLAEMAPMEDAGFTVGNGGIFGEYLTQPKPAPTYPVDNICVKGPKLKLQNCAVLYDCELSDHYPMVADIIVG